MWICWLGVAGCDWIDNIHPGGQTDPPAVPDRGAGRWVNRYPGRADLVGVQVRQFPEHRAEAARYEGRHPATIIYVFKDGRANRIDYEPDGAVRQDHWFRLGPGDPLWNVEPPPAGNPPPAAAP
jgi:hypothetical protein